MLQLPQAASEDQPPPVADTARFPLHGHHRPCFHLPLIICQRAVKGVDGGRGAGRETQQGLRAHLVDNLVANLFDHNTDQTLQGITLRVQ